MEFRHLCGVIIFHFKPATFSVVYASVNGPIAYSVGVMFGWYHALPSGSLSEHGLPTRALQ